MKNQKIKIHLKLGKVSIGKRIPQFRSVPCSPNYLKGKHWAIGAAWRDAWKEEVWYRWLEIRKNYDATKLPFKMAKITPYVFSIKAQDHDNFLASLKPLIDSLKDCKIITDDNYEHLKYNPEIHVPVAKREVEHIEFIIEEA